MSSPKTFKIGLLGTGNIGTTLATKLIEAGHTVKAANSKGPETLPKVFSKAGVQEVWAKDAVKDVDVIIISTPPSAFSKTKALLSELPESVAVLDTFNHYPLRDGNIQEIEDGKVESIWASEQLGRGVTKGQFAEGNFATGITSHTDPSPCSLSLCTYRKLKLGITSTQKVSRSMESLKVLKADSLFQSQVTIRSTFK